MISPDAHKMTTNYLCCDTGAQCKPGHHIKRFVCRDEDIRATDQPPDRACNVPRMHDIYCFLLSAHRPDGHLGAAAMAGEQGGRLIEITEHHFEAFGFIQLAPEEPPAGISPRRNNVSIARLSARATSY